MSTTELERLLGVGESSALASRYRVLEACNTDKARYLRCKAFDERRQVPVHLDVICKHDRFDIAYRREFHALRQLKHPSIIKPYDFFEDERCVVMATEWVDGVPLTGRGAKIFDQKETIALLAELARTLSYANVQGIRHVDLQPDRIIVVEPSDGGDARLAIRGFGFAPDIGWGACGDDRWTCLRHNCYSQYDESADNPESYSWGVIAFELLSGALPFYANDEAVVKTMHRMIMMPPLHTAYDVPVWLSTLVAACLDKRPDKRPALDEIVDCLQQGRAPRVERPSSRIASAPCDQAVYYAYLEHLRGLNQIRLGLAPASASLLERVFAFRK